MDTTKAWASLGEIFTDGDNVWVVRGGAMVALTRIGQDIDGTAAATETAAVEAIRQALANG